MEQDYNEQPIGDGTTIKDKQGNEYFLFVE